MTTLLAHWRRQWQQWPAVVRQFFARAFLLVIAWKLAYLFWLLPLGQPNRWLTNSTAASTAIFLNSVGEQPKAYAHFETQRAHVYNERQQNLLIGNSCNGLELHILYAGFLLCLPTTKWQRLLIFLVGGLLAIYAMNVLRCAGLYWLMVRNSSWQDVAHKFIFKGVLYSFIAAGWYAYARKV